MTQARDLALAARPRTRPRDRRQTILTAAAEQFRDLGFQNVSMADIAAAVGIGASALYYHFKSKQDLLRAVVRDVLASLEAAVADAEDLDEILVQLAHAHFEARVTAVLWQREARYLEPEDRKYAYDVGQRLKRRVEKALTVSHLGMSPAHADLRAWAVLSVLGSPAQHAIPVDSGRTSALLLDAARAIGTPSLREADTGSARAQTPRPRRAVSRLVPASRREALLAAAIELLSQNGYQFVSLSEIGAAAGIAGPSVYNHFESKADILITALNRGHESLMLDLQYVLHEADTAEDAIGLLMRSYVEMTLRHTALVSILTTEVINLPEEHQLDLQQRQGEYVTEWVSLVRQVRAELSDPEARVLVHAVLTLFSELARTPHLLTRPHLGDELCLLGAAVLAARFD